MRLFITIIFFHLTTIAFCQVDHWESVVLEGDNFSYLVPTSEPPANWTDPGFDDNSWSNGSSGFGYGDGDDNTQLSNGTISVYLRTQFNITNLSVIDQVVLHMDFDDGFVAYLNGTEIARSYLSGTPPAFNRLSDDLHEARLYQGLIPESIQVDPGLLQQGTNVLAVQVHNFNATSSDLTANPTLSLGITDQSFDYRSTPPWFREPTEFLTSELPIVIIDTQGQQILNDPKIPADFGIIYNGEGQVNRVTDPWNEYNGYCGIELRGESSLFFEKSSFGIETWDVNGNDVDASFLNFPEEEDFILYGPYSDKTLLNNVLAMHIARRMGQYASRTRLIELVVNGEYQGVYVLMERIKVEDTRLDIAKLNPDENAGDDLTGGYIIRIDKGEENGFQSLYNVYNGNYKLLFQFFYPDPDEITDLQANYIENYVDQFEKAIASGTYRNPVGRHYTEYINLKSFVDNWIINELSKNVDAYRLSSYFHKDKDSKGGKLNAGPIWDYNLSFGNGDYCGGDITTGYEYYQCVGNSPFWWDRMQKDTLFTNFVSCRWNSLRESFLHPDSIDHFIDSTLALMPNAIERNYERWPTLGIYLWPNPPYFANAQTHEEVISAMKNWIRNRGVWLDENLTRNVSDCGYYENFTEIPSDIVTGLDDPLPEFSIFPNPSQGLIRIGGKEPIRAIRIINFSGKEVFEIREVNSTSVEVQTFLSNGTYIVLVETDQGISKQKLILLR